MSDAIHSSVSHSSRKRYLCGTHRACTPSETWERIEPILPRFGITRIADVTGLDVLGVPVYQAIRPASRNICASQGKGLSVEAAMVSAAMEALELAHAECLEDLEQELVSVSRMKVQNSIRHGDLAWSQGPREAPDLLLAWLRAESLLTNNHGWLPRDMIELDFCLRPAPRPNWFRRTSNGLASGNTRDEALVHALSELIERHALALVQQGHESRRPITTESVRDESVRDLIDTLHNAGAKLALYDSTCRMGVPVLSAEIVLPDIARVWGGSGCHLSPTIAVSRAITEAAQSRLTYLSGARDDLEVPEQSCSAAEVYDRFQVPSDALNLDGIPDLSSANLDQDVLTLSLRLDEDGHPPYFVDLSRPGLPLSVVRAYARGLEEVTDA